jgi:hypothetical protein
MTSRESGHRKESAAHTSAQEIDLDAEHDADVSRRTSNAALRRSVQKKAGGEAREPAQDAARRGIQSPTTAMPHGAEIQRAFGAHDISHIQAHTGDGSAAAMGAEAYATGHHVVFDKPPDLHTAAHEAAHVVQQARGVNLYGGVGEAGDAYERHADEVADRVVQGKSAEDLLGQPTHGGAQSGVVQAKAPSQADADQHLVAAFEARVKLTAARMNAGAAEMRELLKLPTGGAAGTAPMMIGLEAQYKAVIADLGHLSSDLASVQSILKGKLDDELGTIIDAFHASWAPALNSVSTALHDKDGNLYSFAQGIDLSVTTSRGKMEGVFRAAGADETKIKAVQAPRIRDPDHVKDQRDAELITAEKTAVTLGMSSMETALALVKADLHSSVADQSKETLDLKVSVEQLVSVLEPISPDHFGKIAKLPILIKEVEALQAEVMKMKEAGEDKGKALAPQIGHNTQLSTNLFKLKTKIKSMSAAGSKRRP